ncbi:unnamed protein product [Cochlearia groenlandica]
MGRTFSYSLSDPTDASGFGVDSENEKVTSRNHYPDDPSLYGLLKVCYCGSDAIIEASTTRTNPGRLYYTCPSRDDGECHIWKWWDKAMMEELTEVRREVSNQSDCTVKRNLQEKMEEVAALHELLKKTNSDMDDMKKLFKMLSLSLITLLVIAVAVYIFK